jgi:uncharacterized membrane protein YdjX (TVP38/TMEM64 family)
MEHVVSVADLLRSFQQSVVGLGPAGWLVYALVYAACCVLFVPASILTLGAGAIYGLPLGFGIVLTGASLGATASFLLARGALRKRVEKMTAGNPGFRALDRAIAREGAKIVLLVRLSPLFPFTYVNYAFGLTGIRTVPYVIATVVGMLPGTLAFVWLGTAAATAAGGEGADATRKALQIGGALIALGTTLFVARLATRAVREAGANPRGEASPHAPMAATTAAPAAAPAVAPAEDET